MGTSLRLVVALAAALVLTACSSEDTDQPDTDPSARLQAAADTITAAPAIEFSLATEQLPSGVTGLLSVKGQGNDSPAFQGEARVSAGGTALPAEVVAVDGQLWVKTGFSSEFLTVNPEQLGVPDPAQLVGSGEDSAVSLLTSATDLDEGDEVRDGRDVLTTITGTIPGADVARLLTTADENGDFEAEFRLTEDDVLRDVVVTGPFYAGSDDVTYTLTITALDSPVEITAPTRPTER
ncbi:LppX_LprAFG lipoprotein [Aeromicrobium phragmitis]|uniref:LppX_LprAFG lipoprotein n=1 Tax=Aeromicrobium phragmitis TaxID=2478914 RepID=UPI00140761B1|nr:LppX_LprAFG lipoprotein [Aeromicrobium phragmitis]